MNTGIKVIEKITPVFKDRIFIFVLSQLVVDVIEADALRISFPCTLQIPSLPISL